MEDKTTIVGRVIFKQYSNDNFSILIVEDTTDGNKVNIKGYNLPDDHLTYEFVGKLKNDSVYGKTLECEFYKVSTSSRSDIIKYLSNNVDGVGKKTAQKLFDVYGDEVLDALKSKEKIEAVVKGKTAEKIYESAKRTLVDNELYTLLIKYDIPFKTIGEISSDLDNAKEEIQKNPFLLTKYNISFSKMNKMAITFGVKLKSSIRINCAVHYYLIETIASRGHVFSHYKDLVSGVTNILNTKDVPNCFYCSNEDINRVLHKMKQKGTIKLLKVNGEFVVYSKELFDEERLVVEEIIKRVESKPNRYYSTLDLKPYITTLEQKYQVKLSEQQKLAIKTVINSNVSVITGSAGTGKTTVLKFCIEIFKEIFNTDAITLLAPTGRAARRMHEKTGWDASTIHSRLGLTKDGGVTNYIDDNICFVDEMSMTGLRVTSLLLENVSPRTRLVFLGDPQQLPSVEAGNVLGDLISSNVVPKVKLDVIYRQSNKSLIVENANKIISGKTDFETGEDFVFIDKTGSIEIQKAVLDVFCDEFFDKVKDVYEVQVITPMRERGYLSCKALNLIIQEAINPLTPGVTTVKCNGYDFRVNDKVICQKNTDTVKNGDIGVITNIWFDGESGGLKIRVNFNGNDEDFSKDDFKELKFVLAFCITVHKAQGAEFKTCIIPINYENKIMLKRNLLYTAVTRASKKMIIVGSRIHYWDAVRNNPVEPRNSLIGPMLIKEHLGYYGRSSL